MDICRHIHDFVSEPRAFKDGCPCTLGALGLFFYYFSAARPRLKAGLAAIGMLDGSVLQTLSEVEDIAVQQRYGYR